jgi:hypothetical protein
MCRPNERTHKHHITPRYMGGTDEPENLVEVTVTQHAMFHFCNYQLWGNEEDRIAWRGLSGQITFDEAALEAQSLGAKKGGKIGGNKTKENKTGIFGLSPEEKNEARKKAGNKTKENKTGIFGLSLEEMSKNGKIGGKKGGNKTKENKTGIFSLSPEEKSENSKKGGKIGGNKTKENKTGIFGLSPEEKSENSKKAGNKTKENKTGIFGRSLKKHSEDSKKAGKTTSSQKWRCTETGYISHASGLTSYQNKRGIDTSNRIKVDGPRGWKITFEDGKVVVTHKTLKEWAKENGYSYDCLRDVRRGKTKNHRGIIKVICL